MRASSSWPSIKMPASIFAYILLRVAAQVGLEPSCSSSSSRTFNMPWISTSTAPADSGTREIMSRDPTSIRSWLKSPSAIIFHVLFAVVVGLLASVRHLVSREPSMPGADMCVSHDSPNPLALQHPDLISGTLNGTTLIVPIPLSQARELIPSEYGISEATYRSLLPSFPKGMYPMVAQIVHDHDIQFPAYNASLPDFSRASFEFPFVDVLGTGHSSFRWAGTFLISASNPMAIEGSRTYGMSAHAAAFEPPCDAYGAAQPDGSGATYAHSRGVVAASGTSDTSSAAAEKFMSIEARPAAPGAFPYPLSFLENVANQPVFAGDARKCDYYRRVFDTALTRDSPPVPVRGAVSANLEPFAGPRSWAADEGVYGWQLATAFLEPPATEECR